VKPKRRPTRAQTCGRKKKHADKAAAERHMDRLVRGGASPDILNVYKCRFGPHWHVGHIVKNGR